MGLRPFPWGGAAAAGHYMDLRTSFPRSMRIKLEAHVHLPRMVDKCRAVLAGTEGEYRYPCPLDVRLLEFAGLTSEQFTAAVKASPTDDGVVDWFRRTAKTHAPGEVAQWNEMMLGLGPATTEQQELFNRTRDAIDPGRTDLTSWADLQDLEEGRLLPRRTDEGPSHSTPH